MSLLRVLATQRPPTDMNALPVAGHWLRPLRLRQCIYILINPYRLKKTRLLACTSTYLSTSSLAHGQCYAVSEQTNKQTAYPIGVNYIARYTLGQ